MGLFDIFKRHEETENRAQTDHSYGNLSITSFFGNGEKVTEEEALRVPSVTAAIELVTSSIAQLPVYLYKLNEKDEVEKIKDRRLFLLNKEPNELLNGYNFKKQLAQDYLLHGASYTKIEKVRNDVIALYNLPIKEISITKYKHDGYKNSAIIKLAYPETGNKINYEFIPEELIIVLKDSKDGVTSKGILANNSDIIQLAIDEQDYSIGILKNGALPIGILKSTSRLTETAINRLRASWETLYGGAKKSGKTIILEEGLDYHPISMKPNEMDLTNSKKSTVAEIARIFNIPQSMIDASANKYASNEQNNIHFLQYCLAPIILSIESSINKSLLLESEKQEGFYFRFDTSEILRTTEAEQIDTMVVAMKAGLLSINEARSKIHHKAIDTDYFTWGLGSVFYNPKTGEMTIPNIGKVLDPNKTQEENDKINENQEELETESSQEYILKNIDQEEV